MPEEITCEMVTLEFPELVSVRLCEALLPAFRLPKLSEVGLAESCSVGATPVPLSATLVGELGALLTSARLPEKVPAEAGANPTLKEAVPPGAMERGNESPDSVYPVPLSDAWVTLRVAEPGFCTVMVCVLLAPVMTLPKLIVEGATVMSGWTPAPVSEIVVGELVAVLTTLMLPATLPAAAGANPTLRERLWPAARVTAPEKPLTLKPLPEELTCETVTEPVPVLERLMACDAPVPTS